MKKYILFPLLLLSLFGYSQTTQLMYTNNGGMQGLGLALPAGTTGQVLTQINSTQIGWQNAAGGGWSLTGNSGTTPGTNFIGTTDGEALEFKVDGVKAGWIDYTSPSNTSLGYQALLNISSGTLNTAFGLGSLSANTSGSGNAAQGHSCLASNTIGMSNTAMGNYALFSNIKGSANTSIGRYAGDGNIGSYNSFFGDSAGWWHISLSNQFYLGDSIYPFAFTAIKFSGSIMPYYNSNYQSGTSGQVLTSEGPGVSPQWANSGGNYFHGTDSVGSGTKDTALGNSAIISFNGYSARGGEIDTVDYTANTQKNIGYAVLVTAYITNMSDGETLTCLYKQKTTHWTQWTFPTNGSATMYTLWTTSHAVNISGQSFTFEATTGTAIWRITITRFNSDYTITISQGHS